MIKEGISIFLRRICLRLVCLVLFVSEDRGFWRLTFGMTVVMTDYNTIMDGENLVRVCFDFDCYLGK
jgi:hypothetical protein